MLVRIVEKHRSVFWKVASGTRAPFRDRSLIFREIATRTESVQLRPTVQVKKATDADLNPGNDRDATRVRALNRVEPNQPSVANLEAKFNSSPEIVRPDGIAEIIYSAGISDSGSLLKKSRREYATKILNCKVAFSARSLCRALCGLQNLRSYEPDSILLLSILTKQMTFSVGELSAEDIGNALFGLQGMNSGVPEVQSIITALTSKLLNNTSTMQAADVGRSLFGMQNFSDKDKPVQYLLRCLVPKMQGNRQKFTSAIVGNSMVGLRRMNVSSSCVKDLVCYLTEKISTAKGEFLIEDMVNAISGLQGLDGNTRQVQNLILALLPKLKSCEGNFKSDDISIVLGGLKKLTSGRVEVRDLLSALLPKIEGNTVGMSTTQMAKAMNGLQGMSSENATVQRILLALIPAAEVMEGEFNARLLGMTIYGFKCMNISRPQVRSMLQALFPKIEHCGPLDALAVSASMYALRYMTAEYPEGCMLLHLLAKNIKSSKEITFGAQEIGNSLYGMQGMSTHKPEVREMLLALTPHIESFKGQLLINHQSAAMYGLQNMSSDSPEVLGLLRALLPCISAPVVYGSQHVGNVLYGLQGMRSDSAEMKSLLLAIIPKIRSCEESLSEQELGNALYGFKSMSGDCSEVRLLLTAMKPLVLGCQDILTAESIGAALFGLRGCYQAPEIEPIMSYLSTSLVNLQIASNDFRRLTLRDAHSLGQNLCLSQDYLKRSIQSSNSKWFSIFATLSDEMMLLQQRNEFKGSGSEGKQEKVFLILARKLFKGSNIEVFNDIFLMDLFQSDIIINIVLKKDSTKSVILNIELDGPSHGRERKVFFSNARDKYLRGCGIQIERLDIDNMAEMSDEVLQDWLLDKVALALLNQKVINQP